MVEHFYLYKPGLSHVLRFIWLFYFVFFSPSDKIESIIHCSQDLNAIQCSSYWYKNQSNVINHDEFPNNLSFGFATSRKWSAHSSELCCSVWFTHSYYKCVDLKQMLVRFKYIKTIFILFMKFWFPFLHTWSLAFLSLSPHSANNKSTAESCSSKNC